MEIALPQAVEMVIQKLNTAGYEAYAVGGCVRDSLMGKAPTDWDITTSATPAKMQVVFAEYRTIETGLQHGTLTLIVDDTPLEITTYRLDGNYSDGRHPDKVTFSRCLSEDLCRRDFTINAMAYHPQLGLVDLFGGQNDLLQKTIRCVGNAQKRFSEDALRILRALRFASVLGFEMEPETDTALRRLSPTLARVSAERIAAEMNKLICGQGANIIASRYADVLANILPSLDVSADYALLSSVSATPAARWAALFWNIGTSTEQVVQALRSLRLDNHTIRIVEKLLNAKNMPCDTDAALLRLLYSLGAENIWDYLSLRQANHTVKQRVENILTENRCYTVSMLAVDGNDVINAGVSAGPDVGKMLAMLLDAVIDGRCPNERELLLLYMTTRKKPVQ